MQNKQSSRSLAHAIAALVTLALIAGTWFGLLSGSQKSSAAAQLELKGNDFARAITPLLFEVSNCYWSAQHSASGDHNAQANLKTHLDQAEQLLKKVESAEQSMGKDLQFTKEGLAKRQHPDANYAALAEQWRTFRDNCNNPRGGALDSSYQKLNEQIVTMISHATDTSGMVLDDTLDSFYLINSNSVELPRIYENIAQMSGKISSVLSRSRLSSSDRSELVMQAAGLDDTCDRVYSSVDAACKENQNSDQKTSTLGTRSSVSANLPGQLKEFTEATDNVLALLQKISTDSEGNWRDWSEAISRQNAAAEKLFNSSATELDGMLQTKVSHWGTQRMIEWVGVALIAGGVWAIVLMPGPVREHVEIKIRSKAAFEEPAEQPESLVLSRQTGKVAIKTKIEPKAAKTPDNLLISGMNSHTMVVEIMQLIHRLRKTGKLVLKSEVYNFNIYFDHGKVIHADSDRFMRGEPSFQMSIRMSTGTYQFLEEQELKVDQSINGNTDHLIMEAVRLMDENHVIEPIGSKK